MPFSHERKESEVADNHYGEHEELRLCLQVEGGESSRLAGEGNGGEWDENRSSDKREDDFRTERDLMSRTSSSVSKHRLN